VFADAGEKQLPFMLGGSKVVAQNATISFQLGQGPPQAGNLGTTLRSRLWSGCDIAGDEGKVVRLHYTIRMHSSKGRGNWLFRATGGKAGIV